MDKVFISYAIEDIKYAKEIYEYLLNYGVNTWFDRDTMIIGQDIDYEISNAIPKSSFFIACLSRNSVSKQGYVQKELKIALKILNSIPKGKIFILPVRLDECKIPKSLENRHYIDWFNHESRKKLLDPFRIKIDESKSPQYPVDINIDTWVGRFNELNKLFRWYNYSVVKIGAIIGLGGSGKTTLVRKWCAEMEESIFYLQGIFFWNFYEQNSIDQFIEGLLMYVYPDTSILMTVKGVTNRIDIILEQLSKNTYIIVLDGIEVLQIGGDHEILEPKNIEGLGKFKSPYIRNFLFKLLNSKNNSYCLITSRVPLLELQRYENYQEHILDEKLSRKQSCQLLRNIGIIGAEDTINYVAKELCYDYPLAITIIGDVIAWTYNCDVDKFIENVNFPSLIVGVEDKNKWGKAAKALRIYTCVSDDISVNIFKIISCFRYPINIEIFEVILTEIEKNTYLENFEIRNTLLKLAQSGMIINERKSNITNNNVEIRYTVHPIIKSYFLSLTNSDFKKSVFYLSQKLIVNFPTQQNIISIDALEPAIELCHLSCLAQDYETAWYYYNNYISFKQDYVHLYKLGAYEATLYLLEDFFENSDIKLVPKINDIEAKREILNTVGLCLMYIGSLKIAATFIEKKIAIAVQSDDYPNASQGHILLSELNYYLGNLDKCILNAKKALEYSEKAKKDKHHIRSSLARLAWGYHLIGKLDIAKQNFEKAKKMTHEINNNDTNLFSSAGIFHSDHLLLTKNTEQALEISQFNLEKSIKMSWPEDISLCYRAIGDIKFSSGEYEQAKENYDTAVSLARTISRRDVLIEALIARGRWFLKNEILDSAFIDLNEGLGYAIDGDYKIYEMTLRLLISEIFASNNPEKAKVEREKAISMNNDINYFWFNVKICDKN